MSFEEHIVGEKEHIVRWSQLYVKMSDSHDIVQQLCTIIKLWRRQDVKNGDFVYTYADIDTINSKNYTK